MTDLPDEPPLPEQYSDREGFGSEEDSRRRETPRLRERFLKPGIALALTWVVIFFIFQFAFGVIVGVVIGVLSVVGGGRPEADMTPILNAVMAGNLLFSAAVVLAVFRSHASRILSVRGVPLIHLLLLALAVVPLSVFVSEISNLCAEVLPVGDLPAMFSAYAKESWIMVLFFACLLPGVSEELLFRGYLGRGLVARRGVTAGVLWTSFLFGLLHVYPVQAISVMPLGVALHLAYLGSKSIVAPVLLHTANNAIALLCTPRMTEVFPIRGYSVVVEDDILHTPLPIVVSALLTVLALGVLYYQTRIRWVTPEGKRWDPGYVSAEQPPADVCATPRLSSPRLTAVIVAAVAYLAFVAAMAAEILLP